MVFYIVLTWSYIWFFEAHQFTKSQAQRKVRAAAKSLEEDGVKPTKPKAKAKGKAKAKAKSRQPKAKAAAKTDDAAGGVKSDDLSDEDKQIKQDMAVESFQEGLENTKVAVNPKRKRDSERVNQKTEKIDKTPLEPNENDGKPTNRNLEEEFKNADDGVEMPAVSSSSGLKRPLPPDQEPLA